MTDRAFDRAMTEAGYAPLADYVGRYGDEAMINFFTIDPAHENTNNALRVLDLIVAEFESDPMSVQCFARSTVDLAKEVISKQKMWERSGKLPPLLSEGQPHD